MSSGRSLSFLLPTRGRPSLARRFLDSVVDTTADIEQIEVVLGVDAGRIIRSERRQTVGGPGERFVYAEAIDPVAGIGIPEPVALKLQIA